MRLSVNLKFITIDIDIYQQQSIPKYIKDIINQRVCRAKKHKYIKVPENNIIGSFFYRTPIKICERCGKTLYKRKIRLNDKNLTYKFVRYGHLSIKKATPKSDS